MIMKALVYNRPRNVTVSEMPEPRIDRPGDAVIQITRASEGDQHFDARDQGWTKVVLSPAA
jgi:hypothetical protein